MLHLYPKGKNIIVFIDGSNQLVDILVFLLFDPLLFNESFLSQFLHFVDDTVYVRVNSVDNSHTCFLYQILPFVPRDVLLVNVALLFQSAAFVAKGDGRHAVVDCPLDIGSYHPYHRLLILAHPTREH